MVLNTRFNELTRFVWRTSVITVCQTIICDLRPIACIGDGAFFVGTPAANPIEYRYPICPGEPS